MISSGDIAIWPQDPKSRADGLTANGWFSYGNDNMVWIRHQALPDARCALRVPEEVSWEGRKRLQLKSGTSVKWLGTHDGGEQPVEHNYQMGQEWKVVENRLQYEPIPLRNPFGPSPGTISACIRILGSSVVVTTVTISNTSADTLKSVSAHFCLNHRMSPFLGRLIYAKAGRRWANFNDYSRDSPFRRFAFGATDNPEGCPAVTEPALFTETIHEKGFFTVGIGGSAVWRLMSNEEWPCTDIGLDFGDLAPGDTGTKHFFIGLDTVNKDTMLVRLKELWVES